MFGNTFYFGRLIVLADTIGTNQASEMWGYTPETISKWCRLGLISGASQDKKGSPWHIPNDAVCPRPIRKKEGL